MTATATEPGKIRAKARPGDTTFFGLAIGAGSLILVALAAVAVFLLAEALPAFTADTTGMNSSPANFWAYVGPLAFGTVWSSFLALLFAVPLSLGIALFISHYAPRRIAQGLGYVIDLLAAVPSVIFGLWGIKVLAPAIVPLFGWLNEHLGWLPFFAGQVDSTGHTILTVAIVLAVMIIPIITSLCREIFLQTPKLHEEAALALGATRWEMIKMAVLPFGRPGIVSATMLGLGRALGETMVVAMLLSPAVVINFVLTSGQNPSTIAGNIALQFPEAHGDAVNILIATGLILFVITLVVNSFARWIVARRAAFSGAN
ncbi:MAG: phosphate ABC transporter permease subunit PstC [Microbacteriaceae bacterium]|nr:phosphate ABC transporter permease subunit PstC [Microbacteriaceae bacterium]